MNGTYRTVFEVSSFGNGNLNMDLHFLCGGIIVLAFGLILPLLYNRMKWNPKNTPRKKLGLLLLGSLFLLAGVLMTSFDFTNGRKFKSALADNECETVEGMVQVLHEEPWGGHDPQGGDHIRIGDKEFTYSYYTKTLAYNTTISHGGELKNGAVARLHYIGNDILKVEIKQ